MPVGTFLSQNRQTLRAPVNPLDKSTVVSILPKRIYEEKPTIQPGLFVMEPGSIENPSLLVVGPSSWWKEIDESQPLLEIPVSSIQIANSIVRDYCNGLIACDMEGIMPGMFFVPGEITLAILKKEYKSTLDTAITKQRNWYAALVKLGDALYSNSGGNPLAISGDMRLAARELGLTNKDWMADFKSMEMIRCVACGSLRNPLYPICGTCHNIIDIERAKELNILPMPATQSKSVN